VTTSSAASPAPLLTRLRPANLLRGSLLRGGAIFFLSATLVNVGNYAFNLIFGRWLGPALFAEVSLLVTLVLFVSFVAASFTMVTAKFIAAAQATQDAAQVAVLRRWLVRVAWVGGVFLLIVFVAGAPLLQQFFQFTSSWPFVILGLGMPFYLQMGVERGVLQGSTRFSRLALSYQTEMWTRLALAAALLAVGFGVNGIAMALALALVAAWLVARGLPAAPSTKPIELAPEQRQMIIRFALAASGSLMGQILINNSDVLIVKHFFSAEQAGQYAALALIGRIVFFATWSVVTTFFPIVAQKQARGEAHRHLLWIALGLVVGVSGLILGATALFPEAIVRALFGAAYLPIAPLLWMYALATAFYALANVIISYRLSLGNTLGGGLVVIGGLAQVIGLWLFHDTLWIILMIQIVLMAGLFVAALGWDGWLQKSRRQD